jgi:hypothetical protein
MIVFKLLETDKNGHWFYSYQTGEVDAKFADVVKAAEEAIPVATPEMLNGTYEPTPSQVDDDWGIRELRVVDGSKGVSETMNFFATDTEAMQVTNALFKRFR